MGAIAERSGLSTQAVPRGARAWSGTGAAAWRWRVIGACTAFGAICGSSVATTATFARAALPELRRYNYSSSLRDRHHRGRRHARHPHPALDHPGRLRDHHRAEHRQAVHGGAHSRAARGVVLLHRDRARGAARSRRRARRMRKVDAQRLDQAICWRSGRSLVDRGRRGRRHLWRRLHADRGARRSAPSRCWSIALLQRTLGWTELKDSLLQTAETSAMIFAILLGAEVFDAFLGAVAAADEGGRIGDRHRPAALRRHARC